LVKLNRDCIEFDARGGRFGRVVGDNPTSVVGELGPLSGTTGTAGIIGTRRINFALAKLFRLRTSFASWGDVLDM
jgi:hypothetical protein